MKKPNRLINSILYFTKSRKSTVFLVAGIVSILSVGLSSFVVPDNDPIISKIITQLGKWTNDYPIEKVYLQLDKPYYAAGENIWFKAYVTIGGRHQLSALSGSLNVELIDENDSVKAWIKLPVVRGTTWGDFKLQDTLPQGNYRIRAYTNWMRNSGPEYYFDKEVTIVNAAGDSVITHSKLAGNKTVAKTSPINQLPGKVDVQFFPESGNLVNGLNSTVAFKAVGPNGLGVNIKGIVTDEAGNKVTEFNTQHLGMGAFNFTPQNGKSYKALITYADGANNTVTLPAALNTGYVLSINNKDANNISLNVSGSNDLANAGNLYVVGQSGGEVRYVGKSGTSGEDFNATIAKSRFPAGIVQFTLFSSTGEPLNERLAFIQHEDSLLMLNISSSPSVSALRKKVRIDLSAQSNGKPVFGTFSAAVVDDNKVKYNEADETTILSHILLTADLRGYVEQPNYYLDQPNETTRSDLDVLMLTQGYRRFEWKPLMAGTLAAPVYQPEQLIIVSGSVKTLGGKPVPGAKVTLFAPASAGQFMLDTTADSQGNFAFKGMLLKDSIRFIIKAITSKGGKNVVIKMDKNEDTDMKSKDISAINFIKNEQVPGSYLKAAKTLYQEELKYGLGDHTRVLKEVVIKAQPKPKVPHSSNLNGPGNANQIIIGDDLYKNFCLNLADCLPGRLTGVVFHDGLPYSTRGAYTERKPTPMLLIVDGVPQDTNDTKQDLSRIQPSEVSSIEVLRDPGYIAIYGSRGITGVIIITTKRAEDYLDANVAMDNSALIYSPKGYYRAREFYSPQYDDPKTNQPVADLRTTIFWKPNINTDKNGHAFFEYYNAGSPGVYRIIIEGIDGEGHIGRKVYRYKVE